MGLFTRTKETSEITAAQRRVQSLSSHALPDWAETCLNEGGRAILNYRRDLNIEHLLEAQLAADTLKLIVDELILRRSTDL